MEKTDNSALFKISYGLFVLSAVKDGKQNGCIINTVNQITSSPVRLAVAVNKDNYTTDMISATGKFNLSILTEDVPFELIRRFGFESGKTADKFENCSFKVSENGIAYLTEHSNAVISCKTVDCVDCDTHILFIADVVAAETLSTAPSVTYEYYLNKIKPETKAKKGYVCKICGYVYEGDELPEDFICPLCRHPASDFEPIK